MVKFLEKALSKSSTYLQAEEVNRIFKKALKIEVHSYNMNTGEITLLLSVDEMIREYEEFRYHEELIIITEDCINADIEMIKSKYYNCRLANVDYVKTLLTYLRNNENYEYYKVKHQMDSFIFLMIGDYITATDSLLSPNLVEIAGILSYIKEYMLGTLDAPLATSLLELQKKGLITLKSKSGNINSVAKSDRVGITEKGWRQYYSLKCKIEQAFPKACKRPLDQEIRSNSTVL